MNKNRKHFERLLLILTALLLALTILHSFRRQEQPLILETLELSLPEEEQGVLNINTASAAELEELPGIGPVLAGRIIARREENGPFAGREDVLAVSGIGEVTYEAIAPYITFG